MSNLSKEVSDVIKRNIPAEVGDNLRKLLDEGEEAKKERKRLHETIAMRDVSIGDLRNDLSRAEKELKQLRDLNLSSEDLDWRIRQFEIEKVRNELELERQKCQFMSSTMELLLGNRRIRENIQDQVVMNGGQRTQSVYENSQSRTVVLDNGGNLTPKTTTLEREEA